MDFLNSSLLPTAEDEDESPRIDILGRPIRPPVRPAPNPWWSPASDRDVGIAGHLDPVWKQGGGLGPVSASDGGVWEAAPGAGQGGGFGPYRSGLGSGLPGLGRTSTFPTEPRPTSRWEALADLPLPGSLSYGKAPPLNPAAIYPSHLMPQRLFQELYPNGADSRVFAAEVRQARSMAASAGGAPFGATPGLGFAADSAAGDDSGEAEVQTSPQTGTLPTQPAPRTDILPAPVSPDAPGRLPDPRPAGGAPSMQDMDPAEIGQAIQNGRPLAPYETPPSTTPAPSPAPQSGQSQAASQPFSPTTPETFPGQTGMRFPVEGPGGDGAASQLPETSYPSKEQPVFTDGFNLDPSKGRVHKGADIRNNENDPVHSVGNGEVILRRPDSRGPGGNMIWVRLEDGTEVRYMHTASDLKPGDKVTVGQPIGKSDRSGRQSGPHIHMEVLKDGNHVDPRPWLETRKAKRP